MSRIPFQAFGYHEGGLSDGTSEGCKPSPLWTGPRCTCHVGLIDGVKYAFICANCAFESAHIPNPHEPAAAKGRPKL